MNKKFTKLIAALALLVFMMPSLAGWGQSDYSDVETSNCTLTAGTNGSTCTVNGKDGIKVGTSSKGGDMSVTVPAGAKYLHIHVAAWKDVSGLSLNITPNTNISPTSVSLTADSGISSNSPFTLIGDATSTDFYKVITFTNALTAETTITFTTSVAKRFVIWGVNSEEAGGSGGGGSDPEIHFNGSSANIGISHPVGTEVSTSFTVYQSNLTEDITFSIEGYGSLSPESVEQGADPTEVTWSYTPTAAGSFQTTITATSGTAEATYTIYGEAKTVHTVTILPMTNGSVTASPNSGIQDTNIDLTITPEEGYKLETLSVVDEYDHPITVTNNRFQMPDSDVTVSATFEEVGVSTTYDFTQIEGFSDWTNSYSEHIVTYSDATITFASACHQTSTITDQPVTKGGDVSLVMTDGSTISSATFVCTQWGSKAQTITLHYSTDGGENYTSTGVTSTNFSITKNDLPSGTDAVKITFSSQSNQVGIASATIEKGTVYYTVTYNGNGNTDGSVPTDATAYSSGATVTVLGNTGSLAKTGYTFGGWNTQVGGEGTTYQANDTFTITANTTLYAKWNAKTITDLSYEGTPTTTTYYAGQSFDPTGLTVTATFNDASSEDVTALVTWTPDPLTVGTTSVTGTYMEQTINVSGLTVTAVPGSAENPYTVAQAIENTPSSGNVYIHGIVSAFWNNNETILGDDSHRYYISDEDDTTIHLLVYNGNGLNNVAFSSVDDLWVGDEVTICGELTTYNNTKEIAAGNYIVSMWGQPRINVNPDLVEVNAEEHDGTLDIAYVNLTIEGMGDFDIQYYDAENNELNAEAVPDWIEVLVAEQDPSEGEGYVVSYIVDENEGEARTAYFKVFALGDEDYAYSNLITVTQAAPIPTFDVTFEVGVGGTFVGNTDFPDYVAEKEAGTYYLPSATKEGYLFAGWNDGNETYVANAEYQVNANVDFTAQWAELNYSNTYTSNVTLSTSGGTSASTCKVVISDVEYNGIKAGTGSSSGSWKVTVPANTSKLHLHLAAWKDESVTLSVSPDGYSDNIALTANSGISGSGTTYNFSGDPSTNDYYKVITFESALTENITLTFTATTGKRFVVWGVNAEESNDPFLTVNDVNIESTATSGSIVYEVHKVPNPAGTLTATVTTGDWLTLGTVGETIPFTCTANPNTVARTATVTLTYTYGDNETATETVTVTQSPLVVTYIYTLATSIENGKHYIITNGNTKIMGSQNTNNRGEVDASNYYEENEYSIPSDAGIYEFVINGPDADGSYTIYDVTNSGYLYAAGTNSANYLKTETFNNDGANRGFWTIVFSIDDNAAVITSKTTETERKIMRYNNNNACFSCYGSGQNSIYLYVKNETNPQYDFYKDIIAASNWSTASVGWNFIASPLASDYTPAGSMLEHEYDLYQLNNIKWENYKVGDGTNANPEFNLVNGRGYLYANSDNTTLRFSGAINTFTTENNANVKNLSTGWNLIGNPYNIPIYINKPYYVMNAAGTAVETSDDITLVAIPACTGVVIYAGENETVTFSTTAPEGANNNQGNIQMSVAQQATNRGNATTLDNAIVSFNENSQLEKFYFGKQNANLYIPQGTEEYAIVSSEAQGEVPVNFRANENGEYTLTVNVENVEMSYLHLIDNMTGADIDLLQTPSYTFTARTTDYESRFRLVFASICGDANGDNETFAFFNGSTWNIVNEGEATLQVVDLMGRILSSQTVNGNATLNTDNLAAGVYVMRLVSNEIVKTQKIVNK